MHKSRLGGLIIDCNTDDLEMAAVFWTQALGFAAGNSLDPEDENYVHLETGPDDLPIEIQKVTHPSRVHIDIETDNIEAEVARLEKLGAKRVEQVNSWWVMQAPTGHRFCVIKVQKPSFDKEANKWE